MTSFKVYRLVVKYPEGSDQAEWRPVDWEAICERKGWLVEMFAWPRQRRYLSGSGAYRARVLRERRT